MNQHRSTTTRLSALLAGTVLLAAACADPGGTSQTAGGTASSAPAPSVAPTETDSAQPRLAIAHEGGVLVVDATDGEVLLEEPLEGFTRLNPAGDDRHVLLSGPGGFTALDLGSWTEAHGDHGHSYVTDPAVTGFRLEAEEPGHVVVHDGHTTVFDDGTGEVSAFDGRDLAEGEPEVTTFGARQAHHGVAVADPSGRLVITEGTSEERTGVRVVGADGTELASSDACPGVHGEAFAGAVVAFGCEDGVLLVDRTTITRVPSPDVYGRIGNLAGHEESPVLLGDYKSDPDAELERPTRVSLVDTRDSSLRLVDLGASYTFRSLGRTPAGDGLVLGTDGALHVLDVEAGAVSTSVPVLAEWEEPEDWQAPRPTLHVVGGTAYVSDPSARALHTVDLESLAVTGSIDLPVVPNEVVGVTG